MTTPQLVLAGILVATLVVQAALPRFRVLVVACGAGVTCLATARFGLGTARALLADVPWDVIVILVGLGLLTEVFVASRVFAVLAVAATRWSRGDPRRVLVIFAVGMYGVSCLANNLTALLLVLPVLLVQLKLLGIGQRYLTWTLGVLLVACNLGGAATPIGDFPAILLLGRGSMTFAGYLACAMPPTVVGLALLLGFTLLVARPERGSVRDETARRVSLAVMEALHRNVRVDRRLLAPPAAILGAMLVAWVLVPPATGLTPELITWLGVGAALLCRPALGERLARTRVDMEAVLFLLSLFVMVAAVRRTGFFEGIARAIVSLPVSPALQLAAFLVLAGLLTGIFSAGPSMAALLDVAEALAQRLPPASVYVGLALAVCAGSSLFLTAATSGPMAQALAERAELRDPEGRVLRFSFFEFVPVGLTSFALILGVALAWSLGALALSG